MVIFYRDMFISANFTLFFNALAVYILAKTRHQTIVGSMFVQRLRRWPNIDPTMKVDRVCTTSATLAQHWPNNGLMSSFGRDCSLLNPYCCPVVIKALIHQILPLINLRDRLSTRGHYPPCMIHNHGREWNSCCIRVMVELSVIW